jgi:hypothetical protein
MGENNKTSKEEVNDLNIRGMKKYKLDDMSTIFIYDHKFMW